MTTRRERLGQRIGEWTVTGEGRTKARRKLLWELTHVDGRKQYLRTSDVIRLDREHGGIGDQ